MGEKEKSHKESGMCFDNISLAELRKLMGKEGIGSLCREMMERTAPAEKGESPCLQFMRKMMTEQSKPAEEGEKDKEQSPSEFERRPPGERVKPQHKTGQVLPSK